MLSIGEPDGVCVRLCVLCVRLFVLCVHLCVVVCALCMDVCGMRCDRRVLSGYVRAVGQKNPEG